MARNKNNTLNPAAYGLTVQEATRLIRIHDLCKGMDDDAFEQMETELMAAIKQHPELAGELHDVLERAREKVLADGED